MYLLAFLVVFKVYGFSTNNLFNIAITFSLTPLLVKVKYHCTKVILIKISESIKTILDLKILSGIVLSSVNKRIRIIVETVNLIYSIIKHITI